jgi:hypothetical protein
LEQADRPGLLPFVPLAYFIGAHEVVHHVTLAWNVEVSAEPVQGLLDAFMLAPCTRSRMA